MCAMAEGVISRKRSFEAGFKLKVVECAEKESNRAAARKFGVDGKRVREWRKEKRELGQLPSKKKRLEGAGRKPLLPEIKEELEEWIEHLRARNLRVTRSSIQRKAKILFQLSDRTENISASRGWLENFFTLRRCTTVSQRLPADMISKVVHNVSWCGIHTGAIFMDSVRISITRRCNNISVIPGVLTKHLQRMTSGKKSYTPAGPSMREINLGMLGCCH